MITALVGDVGRYAIHDGPGIRSTVFFMGCPLRCPWCHNPEFVACKPQLAFYTDRCISCGDCETVCPENAISVNDPLCIHRDLCTVCGLCASICPPRALEVVGRKYTVDELLELLLRDRLFYEASEGGVTLSGGEPTARMDFCGELLYQLKKHSIHTTIETNGFFTWKKFADTCLEQVDLILIDLKIADPATHERIIGRPNEKILANISHLAQHRPDDTIVRIPLIPGYTDSEKNVQAIAVLLHRAGIQRYSLLAYHPYGISKGQRVGIKADKTLPETPLEPAKLSHLHRFFQDMEYVVF